MDTNALFTLALGLQSPWEVKAFDFSATDRRLEILVDFQKGSTFPGPVCGLPSKVHDTEEKTWRHLDFFQHAAYLTNANAFPPPTLAKVYQQQRLLENDHTGTAALRWPPLLHHLTGLRPSVGPLDHAAAYLSGPKIHRPGGWPCPAPWTATGVWAARRSHGLRWWPRVGKGDRVAICPWREMQQLLSKVLEEGNSDFLWRVLRMGSRR
jgi:hypothetical protein